MTRTEFPESVKRAALEGAGHRCQDPLCGRFITDAEYRDAFAIVRGIPQDWMDTACTSGAALADLEAMRAFILEDRFKFPRLLNLIIRKFKLDGGALLEVDHERECADGGAATVENAIVRCVFCHFFKTQARANSRRRAPRKAPPDAAGGSRKRTPPEQLSIIRAAGVADLQHKIDGKLAAGRLRGGKLAVAPTLPRGLDSHTPPPSRERRHYSESDFQEAARRRELAILNNDWGC